jgi:uncharacterized protein DUF6884
VVARRRDSAQAARTRKSALSALFAYLDLDPHSRPLVLLTRFDVIPEAECHEGFYVTVGDAPYEVYHLRGGGYDVESSDDLSPTHRARTDEEKRRQFACAVALHACGLTLREAIEVEARMTQPVGGGLLPGQARSFQVTFRAQADSSDRVAEVDEIPAGEALEYVARGQGESLHRSPPAAAGRSLLILGCSTRKRPTTEMLPAIERYDGPLYRVLRKALREGTAPQALDILIISARYGLLRATDRVECYDQRMTRGQAAQMRGEIGLRIVAELSGKTYSQAHISLGSHYLAALGGVEQVSRYVGQVSLASGGIGQRQAQLRDWLLGMSNAPGDCSAARASAGNRAGAE